MRLLALSSSPIVLLALVPAAVRRPVLGPPTVGEDVSTPAALAGGGIGSLAGSGLADGYGRR